MESTELSLDKINTPEPMDEKMIRAKKLLLIISIVGICMFFAGLTSMHIVSRGAALYWLQIKLPQAFWASTVIMLLSSLTMWMAVKAAKKDDRPKLNMWLLMSLLLGLGFMVSQWQGWTDMWDKGLHLSFGKLDQLQGDYGIDYQLVNKDGTFIPFRDGHYYDPTDATGLKTLDEEIMTYGNPSARNIQVLSILHAAHVVGGILWLVYLVIIGLMGRLGVHNSLKVSQGATYWHFVDVLWILLLLFLYLFH